MSITPTILITGATSGIGQLAAIELARQGARLAIIARSESRAIATRAAIEEAAPGAEINVHYADLASLEAVAAVASEIDSRYSRIDVLINNAGLHAFEQRVTKDGFSEMVAVNYLAPWLLTHLLREKLVASAPSRIVTVASEASRRSFGLNPWKDVLNVDPFTWLGSSRVYGRTKLMNIMFSGEIARQLKGTGVTANCLDPGFNVTGLGRELSFSALLARTLNWLKIGDPKQGAGIIVRLASDPDFGSISGGYFSVDGGKPLTPVAPGDDMDAQQELWTVTKELLTKGVLVNPI